MTSALNAEAPQIVNKMSHRKCEASKAENGHPPISLYLIETLIETL